MLTGSLPTTLGNLIHLQTLRLNNNNLTGSVLTEFGNLRALTMLQLATNRLSGCVPSACEKFLPGINPQQNNVMLRVCDKKIVLSADTLDLHEGPADYTVMLTGEAPSSAVTISLSGAPTGVTISPDTLVFTASTWNRPKTVMLHTTLSTFVPFMLTHTDESRQYATATLHITHSGSNKACTATSPAVEDDARRVDDCNTLLDARSTLDPAGTRLNWSADTSMTTWTGTTIASGRVIGLELSHTHLAGTIPPLLGKLDSLLTLHLGSNTLTGPLPTTIGNLTRLQHLYLNDNHLTDSIPAALGNLTHLQNLYLNSNSLTGTIPAALGNLTNLQILALSSNSLTGSIPRALGTLTNLQILSLGANSLTDSIPAALGNLTNLQRLYLYSNTLTGSIPRALATLVHLQELNLGANTLTGSIPRTLGTLTTLKELNLGGNNLSGSIPAEVSTLTNLQELNLGRNNLSGSIPRAMETLSGLNTLHLSSNRLKGCIPGKLEHFWNTINPQQENSILPLCSSTIILSTPTLQLQEDEKASYTVALAADPLTTLAVDITGILNGREVDITDHKTGKIHVDTTSLLFTTQNWSAPQRITVHAMPDDDRKNEELMLEHHVRGNNNAASLTVTVTDTTLPPLDLPTEFTLHGNYPNPFNPSTQVAFDLPEPAMVRLEINDLLGRNVLTLVKQKIEAGRHKTMVVDIPDLVSGTYLYRLIAVYGGKEHVRYNQMMLIK